MTENWTNRDVQRDPEDFLKTQAAEREWADLERRKSLLIEDFLRRGGERDKAEKAWRDYLIIGDSDELVPGPLAVPNVNA
jgi:hypothetical protein